MVKCLSHGFPCTSCFEAHTYDGYFLWQAHHEWDKEKIAELDLKDCVYSGMTHKEAKSHYRLTGVLKKPE